MSNRLLLRLLFALVVVGVAWYGRETVATPAGPVPTVPTVPTAATATIGFSDQQHLQQHFHKHGEEFGDIDEAQYLRLAQSLRDRPAGDQVLESVRSDGVVTRFDRSSGAFLAFDRDRTIRTFFRPNDGERYYHRQLARGRSER